MPLLQCKDNGKRRRECATRAEGKVQLPHAPKADIYHLFIRSLRKEGIIQDTVTGAGYRSVCLINYISCLTGVGRRQRRGPVLP